jgi:tetratricopeptide (TPR) repeat protein
MPHLEIRRRTGSIEARELSRDAPVLVGSMPSADIHVDADGVSAVECRISWRGERYEVAAATARGVQWNGKLVRQAPLGAGDVIRVGDVDMILREAGPAATAAPQVSFAAAPEKPQTFADLPSGEYQLRPTSDEEIPVRSPKANEAALRQPEGPPVSRPVQEREARSFRGSRPAQLEVKSLRASEVPAAPPPAPPPAVPLAPAPGGAEEGIHGVDHLFEDVSDEVLREEPSLAPPAAATAKPRPGWRALLRGTPRRPGEQELARSPLVVGLTIGSGALALAAVTIWFVLARERLIRQFNQAQAQYESGLYIQAIEAFEQFAKEHPRHALAAEARQSAAKARVQQALSGAEPDWQAGLKALTELLEEYRDSEEFRPQESRMRLFALQQAERIAQGAAEAAGRLRKRALLAIWSEAVRLTETCSAPENRPEQRLAEIAATAAQSEAAILQQETFDVVLTLMQESQQGGSPMAGYKAFRQLLDRYPRAAQYKPLERRLQELLSFEQTQTRRETVDRVAETAPSTDEDSFRPLMLARLTKARSDLVSAGATAFADTDDGVFAVDAATGELLWHRSLGLNRPYQAIAVPASVPAVLLYSTRGHQALLVHERTGKFIWRQSIPGEAASAPLVHQGQLFFVTSAGTIEQLDLETGEHTASLKFLQPIVGPPAVSIDGESIYVAGRQDVLYVLTRRPLGCQQIAWVGHGEGAIATAPLIMGPYVLLAENHRIDRASLKVFDSRGSAARLSLIDREEVLGHVLDQPVIRGTQLVVPSTNERITAFQVSASADENALVRTASFQVPNGAGGPIYVVLGADDQLWMASTALRRFSIKADSILPDQQQLAVGIAAQAPVARGDSLIVGRRLPYCRAVLLAEADRQRMSLNWQATLGAALLEAAIPEGGGAATYVNAAGDLFRLDNQRLRSKGFEAEPAGKLPIPEELALPLGARRLDDGRVVVWSSGAKPMSWLLRHGGQPVEIALDAPLQAAPVRFAQGVLLPLAGKLRLAGLPPGAAAVEDLPAPIGRTEPPRWLSAASIESNVAVVLDSQGKLTRVDLRQAPMPHLAEVAHWNAAVPVDHGFAHAGDRVAVIDTANEVTLLDALSLEPLGDFRADQPASAPPRLVEGRVLVELARDQLVCLGMAGDLEQAWKMPLHGAALCGLHAAAPGEAILALDDGNVLRVALADGRILARLRLPMGLAWGPAAIGEAIVVGTLDGGLIDLAEPLQSAPFGAEGEP